MRKLIIFLLIFITAAGAFGLPRIGISGSVEWDTMLINAAVSLDLASAGIRLPAGRTHGEAVLSESYLNLILPGIMGLRVDSSSTIADLVNRGELRLWEIETLALKTDSIAPALTSDMRNITSSHSISISNISSTLLRHSRPSPVSRLLNPVSTASYTGIVIIAVDELPVHSMRSTALPVPCLFPKIWDSDMNLIFERNMLDPRNNTMIKYSSLPNIFANNPSGISAELMEVVGERPLRIFARGVFGIAPTDLIIDRSDALLIISSEENRRLLSQGRVAIILDESVLRYEFTGD